MYSIRHQHQYTQQYIRWHSRFLLKSKFFFWLAHPLNLFFFGATLHSSPWYMANKKNSIFSVIVKLPFKEATNSKELKMKTVSILTNGRILADSILLLVFSILFSFFAASFFCHLAAVSPTVWRSIWKFSNVSLGVRCQIYVHSIFLSRLLACMLLPLFYRSFVCSF